MVARAAGALTGATGAGGAHATVDAAKSTAIQRDIGRAYPRPLADRGTSPVKRLPRRAIARGPLEPGRGKAAENAEHAEIRGFFFAQILCVLCVLCGFPPLVRRAGWIRAPRSW